MVAVHEADHGRYRIKSGKLSGSFVARAFPAPPAKTQGMIAEAQGATEEAAIAALKEAIAARDDLRVSERRWEERAGLAVPTDAEYVEALRQARLSKPQVSVLKALALAGDDGMTGKALARAAGYTSMHAFDKIFRKAGVTLGDYIGLRSPEKDKSKAIDGEFILAVSVASGDEATPALWIMHPELRPAVQSVI